MSDRSRVPQSIGGFNDYINTATDRLEATNNATGNLYSADYGFTIAQAKDWSARRKDWAENIYPTYTNPATSTSIAKDNVQSFINDFKSFAPPLLDKIAASDIAGNAEEHIFNFVLHRKDPVHHTTPIAEQCVAALHSDGRGMYDIACKAENEKGRAHKVHGADSVQYACTITEKQPPSPATPDDGTMVKDIATTAIFTHDFGAANQGRWLTIYFRWFNTKHPELAGPWSAVQSVAIG